MSTRKKAAKSLSKYIKKNGMKKAARASGPYEPGEEGPRRGHKWGRTEPTDEPVPEYILPPDDDWDTDYGENVKSPSAKKKRKKKKGKA